MRLGGGRHHHRNTRNEFPMFFVRARFKPRTKGFDRQWSRDCVSHAVFPLISSIGTYHGRRRAAPAEDVRSERNLVVEIAALAAATGAGHRGLALATRAR